MKKLFISTILVATSAIAMSTVNTIPAEQNFEFKKISAITLGYDKSMSEKTIKAAVIDSYFRNVCKNGKLIRI